MTFNVSTNTQAEQALTFRLLVGYRWGSLVLPLIWLATSLATGAATAGSWLAFAVAVGLTLLLTFAAAPLNRWLLRSPWLLGLDLLLSALLVWLTGVEHSPYYLYSLAPILAAAFFFHIKGGLLAAAVYSSLYLLIFLLSGPAAEPQTAAGQLISFFLIGAIFGYPAQLLQRLQTAHHQLGQKNSELAQRNRDLNLVRELSLVMQSSVDPAELQESILRGVVHELGYARAVIGLYHETTDTLTSWITLENPPGESTGQMAHTDILSLANDSGPLARSVKGKLVVEVVNGEAPTRSTSINKKLVFGRHYLALPLSLRGQPIGVIIVDGLPPEHRLPPSDRLSLDNLATHAGVALGSMQLCINRAQQVAITAERNRIAADLHDNVSQMLYGLAYGLEASIQMLAAEPAARQILRKLHQSVTEAQALIRQTIFGMHSEDISAEMFVAGLHRRLRSLCPTGSVALRIDLPGNFDGWPPDLRYHLHQIAGEALANAAKHAHARHVVVKFEPHPAYLELRISDDGDGFDPATVDTRQHMGLHSMQERVRSLAGECDISSAFGEGTLITVKVPLETAPVLAG